MFKLEQRDKAWAKKHLDGNVRNGINAALVECSLDPEMADLIDDNVKAKVIAAFNSGEKDLYVRNGVTEKFQFLLADLVKVLLLGVRSIDEEDGMAGETLSNVSEFLKSFLNAACNDVDRSVNPPAFLGAKTLEGLFDETVEIISGRFPMPNKLDAKCECDDVKSLVRDFARRLTMSVVGMGIAKDVPSAVECFRRLLNLLGSVIRRKKLEFEGEYQDEETTDDSGYSDGDETDETKESKPML